MQPVAAAADVRQDEPDVRMAAGEGAQLDGIGGLLTRPVAAAMLPDMLQHGHAPLAGELGNRVEQPIVGPAARRQLDADHPRVETAHDFGARVRRVIRIDADVATDAIHVLAL